MLWILEPIDPDSGPWEPWYDKAFGFVVRASDEQAARQFAAERAGDERNERRCPQFGNPWLDPALSTCEPLTADGEAGVILRDFAAA